MTERTLAGSVVCRACSRSIPIAQALDRCFVSWPHHSWVAFRCPDCEAVNHLALRAGVIEEGSLDGGPGPCFIEHRLHAVRTLQVVPDRNGLAVTMQDRKWYIPAC
jgi:hypothetical protein